MRRAVGCRAGSTGGCYPSPRTQPTAFRYGMDVDEGMNSSAGRTRSPSRHIYIAPQPPFPLAVAVLHGERRGQKKDRGLDPCATHPFSTLDEPSGSSVYPAVILTSSALGVFPFSQTSGPSRLFLLIVIAGHGVRSSEARYRKLDALNIDQNCSQRILESSTKSRAQWF